MHTGDWESLTWAPSKSHCSWAGLRDPRHYKSPSAVSHAPSRQPSSCLSTLRARPLFTGGGGSILGIMRFDSMSGHSIYWMPLAHPTTTPRCDHPNNVSKPSKSAPGRQSLLRATG